MAPPSRGRPRGPGPQGRGRRLARAESRLAPARAAPAACTARTCSSTSETLLGDTTLIDTRGTGKRASQVNAREVAERLGELDMIPVGRIDVETDRIPGRLRITVRRNDPWKHALTHPVIDPASPYARYVEYPATCRKPLVIGGDPETGDPLPLTLWDEDEGGKVVLVGAKKGSGKTRPAVLHQGTDHRLHRRPADPGQPVQGPRGPPLGAAGDRQRPRHGRQPDPAGPPDPAVGADRDRGPLRRPGARRVQGRSRPRARPCWSS